MTLHQLRIVIALLNNNLNISAAAEALCRVQSSVSHQLGLLEEELGGLLFKRKGKRLVEATALCRKLIPEIEKIFLAKKNIHTLAEENRAPWTGLLRIATTHTQARYFLPIVLNQFRKQYPKIKLSFHLGNSTNFDELLKKDEVDIAIFAKENGLSHKFVAKKCYSWNRCLIIPKGHPLINQNLDLQTIAQYPIVTYAKGFADRDIVDQAFQEAGVDLDIILSTSDTGVIKAYVELNLGIGIVAGMAEEKTDRHLVYRGIENLFKKSTTRIIYLRDKTLHAYMQDFIKLTEQLGKTFEKQFHSQ